MYRIKFNLKEAEKYLEMGLTVKEIATGKFDFSSHSGFIEAYKRESPDNETPGQYKRKMLPPIEEEVEKAKESLWEKSIEEVIEESRYSRHYFVEMFKELACMSIHRYEKRLRLKKVKRILIEGGRVHEAQEAAGYKYTSRFSKDFRELTKMTPTQYKDKSLVRGMKKIIRETKNIRKAFEGYDNWSQSYLRFVFKYKTGMTLTEYKNEVIVNEAKSSQSYRQI